MAFVAIKRAAHTDRSLFMQTCPSCIAMVQHKACFLIMFLQKKHSATTHSNVSCCQALLYVPVCFCFEVFSASGCRDEALRCAMKSKKWLLPKCLQALAPCVELQNLDNSHGSPSVPPVALARLLSAFRDAPEVTELHISAAKYSVCAKLRENCMSVLACSPRRPSFARLIWHRSCCGFAQLLAGTVLMADLRPTRHAQLVTASMAPDQTHLRQNVLCRASSIKLGE